MAALALAQQHGYHFSKAPTTMTMPAGFKEELAAVSMLASTLLDQSPGIGSVTLTHAPTGFTFDVLEMAQGVYLNGGKAPTPSLDTKRSPAMSATLVSGGGQASEPPSSSATALNAAAVSPAWRLLEAEHLSLSPELLQQCHDSKLIARVTVAAPGAKRASWFRLNPDTKRELLNIYADVLCHKHAWDEDTNAALRGFLKTHNEHDHFKKCKDVQYDPETERILSIRSLRIYVSPDGRSIRALKLDMIP